MPAFSANTSNFLNLLPILPEGNEIDLQSGEYFGPFIIEKPITIRGTGENTVIFATNEPALIVKSPGVRLENLEIVRTVGGETGEIALLAEPGTSPVLLRVRLTGVASNVEWETANWDIPRELDFGDIETNVKVQRFLSIEVGAPCRVNSEFGWLRIKPSHLSPGKQLLELELNSMGIPAGTRLAGTITLQADDGQRSITITSTIKTNELVSLHATFPVIPQELGNNLPQQDWGYKFVGDAAEKFVRQLENSPFEDDFYKLANKLIFDIAGGQPRLFYVRRKKPGSRRAEEIWELILASDCNNFPFPEKLHTLDRTLSIRGAVRRERPGSLNILSTCLLSRSEGEANRFAVPFLIRLVPFDLHQVGVPQEAWELITTAMPLPSVPGEEQLQAWEAFLKIEERIARERQFCVDFVSHNYGDATKNITFKIAPDSATIDGSQQAQLEIDNFWQRARQARNETVKILEEGANSSRREERELGNIEVVDPEHGTIRVRLEPEICNLIAEGRYRLPATGYLSFEAVGDIVQIRWKKQAIKDLREGQAQNPYLGQFLFNACSARLPQEVIKLQEQDLLLKTANPGQKVAVETVLASPDLVLIQGPPGTGKTTVIAEICYQVARRGGRTLIASQANLAVDNALSRLKHNPLIRAIRKGNRSSVSPEGEPFLEDRVIDTWLRNTAADCEQHLAYRLENVKIFRRLLASSERFTAYLQAESEFEPKKRELEERISLLDSNYREKCFNYEQAQAREKEIEFLYNKLSDLLTVPGGVNWEDQAVVNLLHTLQPYLQTDSSVENFIIKVNHTVELARELDLVPPHQEVFSLSGWLLSTVTTWIFQVRQVLDCAMETISQIDLAKSAVQIFKQHQATLNSLQANYQSILQNPQSLPATIQELQQRKSEINSSSNQLQQWQHQVAPKLSEIIKKSLRQPQILPLIQKMSAGDTETAIHEITISAINNIVTSLDTSLNQVQTEIEQQLQQLELLSNTQCLVENYRTEAQNQIQQARQNLTRLLGTPQLPEQLRRLIQEYIQQRSIDCFNTSELLTQVNYWKSRITQLQNLIYNLSPFGVLSNIKNRIQSELSNRKITKEDAKLRLEESQRQLDILNAQLRQKSEYLHSERSWWQQAWEAIPERLKPQLLATGLFDINFLRSVQVQFQAWQQELASEEAYLNRYERLVSDWIARLGNPSMQDQNELRRIYLNNANVIGITCSQAAKREFSQEFKSFDVVIIDEVSKCTPPELLIPALKAKKLVLVGDHRQLPPMLDSQTVVEIAEQLDRTREEISYLEESLFKSRFEEADESIKKMLNIQYRMHPSIMGAINQFYDGKLECGLFDPDKQRAHHLAEDIFKENQHLIWVKTPIRQGFEETSDGTSFINIKEVDIIKDLCQKMELAWFFQAQQGAPRKEIGIITFYGRQLRLIEEKINPSDFPSLHIRTGTVDRFQGMERQVIIVSLVRNNNRGDIGFARTPERVNVAFSRAQEMLVIVGCHSLFTQQSGRVGGMYSNISNVVRLQGGFINAADILV